MSDQCDHYWVDITTMDEGVDKRHWMCTKCNERATTDWNGPFDLDECAESK